MLREHREHEVMAIDWLALGAAIVDAAQAAVSAGLPRSGGPATAAAADGAAPAREGEA